MEWSFEDQYTTEWEPEWSWLDFHSPDSGGDMWDWPGWGGEGQGCNPLDW